MNDVYDDYSQALGNDDYGANYDDNYVEPKDGGGDKPQNQSHDNGDLIDLRIPVSTAEMDAREETLIALEKNLLEKSARLQDRDVKLEGAGVVEDNWPCTLYPVTYHSISAEIPVQHQSFIRRHYWLLKLTMFALVWNFLVMLVMYIEDKADSTQLMWSTIYMVTGLPGAWKLWYKAIYRAVGSDKRVKFVKYFLFGACHTIFCIVASIGVQATSLMGFLFMVDAMNVNTACGICGVVAFAAWVAISIGSVLMMRRTYRLYKSRGGDLQADSAEYKAEVAGNVATGRMVLQGVNAAR